MDNLAKQNYAEEIAENQQDLTVLEIKAARANYLEHSLDEGMPILQVADLLNDSERGITMLSDYVSTNDFADNKRFDVSIVPITYEVEEFTNTIPQIDASSKSQAYRIADLIMDEVHKFWTGKRKICACIKEINFKNAYSFVGYMITTSDSGSVLCDIKKYITYSEIVHIIVSLLRQAKNAGLVDLAQYRKLKKEHSEILKNYGSKLNRRPDNRTLRHLNFVIEEMYQEMSKLY